MSETTALDHAVNPDVNHETADVHVRGIIWFGVGLAVFIGVAHLALWGMFEWLRALEQRSDRPLPDLARRERPVFPRDLDRIPGPRLQVSEQGDMKRLREEENAALNSKADGKVPIDAALKQMSDPDFAARHGIRVRPEAERERMRELEQAWQPAPAPQGKGGHHP
jgi:hypothetical protein